MSKPFKMMGHELPGPNQKLNTMDNTMGTESLGKNAKLIEALKEEDEVSVEVNKLKEPKNTDVNSVINI